MNEEFQQYADQMATQFGLRPELFRAVVQQESAWKQGAVSPKGAQGLGQVMPATAADPGYGIPPLQNNTWQENLRFSAQYLSKMTELAGSEELGLAAYNAGLGAVQKHKGVPPFAETQDYVKRIMGSLSGEPTKAQALVARKQKLPVFEEGQRRAAEVLADPRVTGTKVSPAEQDALLIANSVQQRAQEREAMRVGTQATPGEVYDNAVINNTLTGAHVKLMQTGERTDWKPSPEIMEEEARMGFLNHPDLNAELQAYRNEEDYFFRRQELQRQVDLRHKVANATGWDAAKLFAADMAGSMADPEAAVLSLGVGSILNGAVRGLGAARAASRLAQSGAFIAEGALSNALVEVGLESAMKTEVSWSNVVQQGAFGAVLSSAFTLPVQARRAGQEARGMADFDRLTTELGEAIDAGAVPSVVQRLQANIDEVKVRMLELARTEQDMVAAQVWAQAGPGSTARDIAEAVRTIRQRADAPARTLDPVNEAQTADIVHSAPTEAKVKASQMTELEGTDVVAGMRLSQEASSVRRFAYDLWEEAIDPALVGMQKRMQDFYKFREGKLGNYAGLAQWLDSPGLIVQTSGSRVARMLGAHLFESATGLGARHQSAALNYEIVHSRLAHNHIPALKEALIDGLKERDTWDVIRHGLGGARSAESAFWRAVAKERLAHRSAVQAKQEHASSASPAIKRAADLLDQFWWEASHTMKKAGAEEGDAIMNGGVVGHIPYQWNHQKVSEALRNDPVAFNALRTLLADEFKAKVLDNALATLNEQGPALMAKRKAGLEADIAAIQEEIGKLDTPRRVVQGARDVEAALKDEGKALKEQEDALRTAERSLKAELKEVVKAEKAAIEAEKVVKAALKDAQQEAPQNFVSIPGSWSVAENAKLHPQEVGRSDLADMIDGFLDQPLKLNGVDKALAQALRNTIEGKQQVVFARDLGLNEDGHPYTAYYDPISDAIFMRWVPAASPEPGIISKHMVGTILHEAAHARTSRMIHLVNLGKKVPPGVAEAVGKLDAVLATLRERFPEKVGETSGVGYAMKDAHELIAQVFNDASVRAALASVELPGNRNFLSELWEIVVDLLAPKTKAQRTALTDVLESLDTITATRGMWVKSFEGSKQFAPTRTSVEIKAQLAQLLEQKRALAAQRKQTVGQRKQATKVKQDLPAEIKAKLDNLNLQRNNRTAALADMQRDPLGWWGNEVGKLNTAAKAKAGALTSSYLQQILSNPESRMRGNTLHAARLAEDLLVENWHGKKVDEGIAEAFGNLLRERLADKSRTEFDLNKSVTVEGREISMLDFFDTDGLSQVKSAAHTAAGKVALAKMGMKDDIAIAAAIRAAETDGATPQEVKALQFGFGFLNNTLDTSDAPAMHALRNMTYFTRMGKLGMSIVADVPQMVSTLGLGLALKTWGQSWLQHSLNGKAPYGSFGKPTPFALQLAKAAPGALGRDHRLVTLVPDNPATGATDIAGSSMLQRTTARGAQFTSWISGANNVNMAMHRALLPVLAEEVLAALTKKSRINAVRMADMGMSDELIARIQTQMQKFDQGRKVGDAINWNKWDDQEAAEELIGVIHRGMFQTLQKSLLGESPMWMVNSSMGRLIGQFRRFGLTAAEKMTARQVIGFQDKQALLTGVMGVTWAGLLYYARVHVNAAGKENAEEYIDEQLKPAALARGVMTMWNMSGLAADLVSVGETMFGSGRPVTGTAPAAALGVLKDIGSAGQAVGGTVFGDKEAKDAVAGVTRLMPGANSVPLTYFLNELNKD